MATSTPKPAGPAPPAGPTDADRPTALTRLALAHFVAAAVIGGSEVALLLDPTATPRLAFALVVGLGLLAALLAAVAGIGTLAGSRRRGYRVGHGYAAVGLASALIQLAWVAPAFATATVVNLVYPGIVVITLARCRDRFSSL